MAQLSNSLAVLFVALLLGLFLVGARAAPKKKAEKKPTGSQKCEKGSFGKLVKDSTIPLCDAHFPDAKSRNDWLVLFYNKDADGFEDHMNRVATDMGNEPPEKSKNLKKPKKQRTRIKDLGEKYEFEPHIPKKGLEEKGKEPLLKVGAVCCDCSASGEQEVCKTRGNGLRIIRSGQEEVTMPDSENLKFDAESIVKWVMGELGFVKGQEKEETEEKPKPKKEEPKKEDSTKAEKSEKGSDKKDKAADLSKKIEELKEKKKKATEDEDFKLAKKLKKEIEDLEKQLKKAEL